MEARRKNRRTDRGSSSSVQYELYRGNPDMLPVVRHQTGVKSGVLRLLFYLLCSILSVPSSGES